MLILTTYEMALIYANIVNDFYQIPVNVTMKSNIF